MGRLIEWFKKVWRKIFKRGEDMPAGLQTFDKNGNVMVDITDRLTKIVGIKRFDVIEPSGSVTIPTTNNEYVWYFLNSYANGEPKPQSGFSSVYDLKLSGNVLSWTLKSDKAIGKRCQVAVIYGVM